MEVGYVPCTARDEQGLPTHAEWRRSQQTTHQCCASVATTGLPRRGVSIALQVPVARVRRWRQRDSPPTLRGSQRRPAHSTPDHVFAERYQLRTECLPVHPDVDRLRGACLPHLVAAAFQPQRTAPCHLLLSDASVRSCSVWASLFLCCSVCTHCLRCGKARGHSRDGSTRSPGGGLGCHATMSTPQ
jgi:hypothetical protein